MKNDKKTLIVIEGDNNLAALVEGLESRGIPADVALSEAIEAAKINKDKNGKFF